VEDVYNYLIEQLNDNTDNLVYRGNYIFRFYEDKMTILEAVSGTLVNEEIDFSPVSVLTKQPIPFINKNNRIDWLLEIGFVVRIAGKEFDKEVDLDYGNIKRVVDDLQGATETINGKRYTFKTQEPSYQGYTVLGRSKYAILSVTLNITQIDSGYFGQDSVFKVDDYTLDIVSVTMNSTRRYYTSSKTKTTDNDYNKPIGRSMVFGITFNYNGEIDLLNEVKGKSDLKKTYTFTETFNSIDYSWTVTAESAQEIITPGGVKQLTFRFVEV